MHRAIAAAEILTGPQSARAAVGGYKVSLPFFVVLAIVWESTSGSNPARVDRGGREGLSSVQLWRIFTIGEAAWSTSGV